MKIELLGEWMGHPKGTRLNILPYFAKGLIERNTAKICEDEDETHPHKIMKRSKDKMIHSFDSEEIKNK